MGKVPIQTEDGNIFWTPIYYCEDASDTILSPDVMCATSKGLYTSFTIHSDVQKRIGHININSTDTTNHIKFTIKRKNGLWFMDNDANHSTVKQLSPTVNKLDAV